MEAVLEQRSRIAPSVAILKPISAAISIGTGGPFGAEGPIIQTGGALGSMVGQALHVTAAERKVLLACGAAAGMAATFSTPIAAVILAIELLLFEFRARSFIPLVVASTVATAMHLSLMGRGAMFDIGTANFGIPGGLPLFALLGIVCGLAAVGLTKALYWFEDLFEKLPIDRLWWPALGGVALGLIALMEPRVLGVGYDTISDLLHNRLVLGALLAVTVWKTVALLVTLGSGTSGGLLAPTLLIGAALGGLFAATANAVVPGLHLDPSAYALAGMAAVFGAASRATFAFIVFGFEITRDYMAVLPLMITCVIADLVGLLMMKNSIMTEKLARRGLKVHTEYEADVLAQVTVGEVMDKQPIVRPAGTGLPELAGEMLGGGALRANHYVLLTDGDGRLAGIITRGDVLEAMSNGGPPAGTALEAGTAAPITCHPDESVLTALETMLTNGVGRLPVVTREAPDRIIGCFGHPGVMAARERRWRDEREREPGWLSRRGRSGAAAS
jgi:H+/Cl- antiporter ClcA